MQNLHEIYLKTKYSIASQQKKPKTRAGRVSDDLPASPDPSRKPRA